MLGRNKSVATLLVAVFPDVLLWHCCTHRLELAANFVAREMNDFYHMERLFDTLH
jgi:hypothetical protein